MKEILTFGTLSIYGDEYRGTPNKLDLEVEVARLPKMKDCEEEQCDYRVIRVLQNTKRFYHQDILPGYYLSPNRNTIFLFRKEKCETLSNDYELLLQQERNTPWTFHGNPTILDKDGHLISSKESITFYNKRPETLDEATKWAFETRPDCFLGSSISKEFPGGDFCINAVPSYYEQLYHTNDLETILMHIANEQGYQTTNISTYVAYTNQKRNDFNQKDMNELEQMEDNNYDDRI